MGSEIVLWRKVYAGFVVRTLGRFPQRTEGWCDKISFSCYFGFGYYVLVLFWSAEHQMRFPFSGVFSCFSAGRRIQTLERKLKALEDERARRSTEDALITLRRHLNRPLNTFDRYEAVELLQSLVRLARNEAHEKADTYAATLDEVKARADLLHKESLQRLFVGLLGDPVRAKAAKEATSILKSSSGFSAAPLLGFRYTRPKPYENTRCFNCNSFGHMARECFFNQRPSQFTYRAPRGGFRGGKN